MAKVEYDRGVSPAQFKKYGKVRFWRLNNLYFVINEDGKRVRFKLRWAQRKLLQEAWYCNIILKARQLGFTTFIDILALDLCLFTDNFEAAIIAHKKEDAEKIFRRKIKYPYDNLPDFLREARILTTESKSQLSWSNNSTISVSTSIRSGTVQFLHISEHGKICKEFPGKAEEIKTGSLNAIHAGCLVFIESTAEGRQGDFYDFCKTAQDLALSGKPLTKLDYKFHFYPWWRHPNYKFSNTDTALVTFTQEDDRYFAELETKIGRLLSPNRRAWYVKKREKMTDKMKQEFPGTPDEAFESSVQGAYYASEFKKIRTERRIMRIPIEETIPVQVAWDMGVSDYMCLWFFQIVGREVRWVDYFEDNGEGLGYYFRILEEKKQQRQWFYGTMHLPHDARVREMMSNAKARETKFTDAGFKTQIAPGPQELTLADGIEVCRNILNKSIFDEVYCDQGIIRLENYRKAWSDVQGCFKDQPLHDENSHGADSFRTGALNIEFPRVISKPKKRRRRSAMAV